jgi:hypothetical protein
MLRDLMEENGLSPQAVAELVHVSHHTVLSWLKNPTNLSAYAPKQGAIELLLYKIGDKPPPAWSRSQ